MSAGKFMKVVWMDLIGVGLISIGLYMIIFLAAQTPVYAPMGFGLMVLGLFFSTIGGFYGKKKLLEISGERLPAIETKQIDQLKQNVVSQLKLPETAADLPSAKPKAREEPRPEPKPQAQNIPPADQSGVIRILMCPGCNTDNPPSNMFCFNCGKRLRAPEKKAGPKAAKKGARPAAA